MSRLLLAYLFFFCVALTEVFSQLQPHLAGGAQSPVHLIGSTPTIPPQRYVVINQTDLLEWESLGSTFTLEFWLWADAAPSNADLNWTGVPDEMQFWSIISRHPGLNYGNEWAHFNLQMTRTKKGAALVFWSGCGCETPMSERDDSSCGFAYLLASDWPSLPPSERFYLKPHQWHHMAVTVDGDSLSYGYSSNLARLYVDGQLKVQNYYADPSNNPPYRTGPVCKGRPIFSQTVEGTKNNLIRIGFYNNQDTNMGTGNSDYSFGFFGYLDELRVWDVARSPPQIEANWFLTLEPQPNLVALYNFNEPITNSTTFPNTTTFPNVVTYDNFPEAQIQPEGGSDSPSAPNNGLIISQLVVVEGSDHSATPTPNHFTFLGDSELGYVLKQPSDAWLGATQNGDAVLMAPDGTTIYAYPANVSLGEMNVIFYCDDEACSNKPSVVDETWIEYASLEDPSVISYVYFQVIPSCYLEFDACGVCGGDNRTCQCVIYHEFRNTRMAYILLTWSLERIIEEIDRTISILLSIEDILNSPDFEFDHLKGNYTLAYEVSYMMDFYNLCLTDYCADVTEFIDYLDSWLVSFLPAPPSQPMKRELASDQIITHASRYVKASW